MLAKTLTLRAPPALDARLERILSAHEEILNHCESLAQLSRDLLTRKMDKETSATAGELLRFFENRRRRIREDMEAGVYPALRRVVLPAELALKTSNVIDRLAAMGKDVDRAWRELREKLERIQEGKTEWLRKTEVRRFAKLNVARIELERTALASIVEHAVGR